MKGGYTGGGQVPQDGVGGRLWANEHQGCHNELDWLEKFQQAPPPRGVTGQESQLDMIQGWETRRAVGVGAGGGGSHRSWLTTFQSSSPSSPRGTCVWVLSASSRTCPSRSHVTSGGSSWTWSSHRREPMRPRAPVTFPGLPMKGFSLAQAPAGRRGC